MISSFVPYRRYEVRGGTGSAGSLITCGRENVRFSTEIAVHIGNGRPTVTMDTTNRKSGMRSIRVVSGDQGRRWKFLTGGSKVRGSRDGSSLVGCRGKAPRLGDKVAQNLKHF